MKITNWFKKSIHSSKKIEINEFTTSSFPKEQEIELRVKNDEKGTLVFKMNPTEAKKIIRHLNNKVTSCLEFLKKEKEGNLGNVETKRVLERGRFITVPKSFIKCSICGIYKRRGMYAKDGLDESPQDRTNCDVCYHVDHKEWDKIKAAVKEAEDNPPEEAKLEMVQIKINENSVAVEDLIESLQGLPNGSRIVIEQDGYYAEGKFAQIYMPQKVKPEDVTEKAKDVNCESIELYSIGRSYQNY